MDGQYCEHHYYLGENTLPGTEGTYHGVYVSNNTYDLDDIADAMSGAGIKPATSKLVIRTMYSKVGELVSTRLCRVSAGPISFEPAASGTVPYANSTLGPDNELYVNVRLSDSLRNIAAGITPKRTDPSEVTARIDGVRSIPATEPKVIVSGEPFKITGWCVSATGSDESLAVVDKDGVSHAAEVIDEEHGQRIIARVAEEIPAGPATVLLMTHGYLTPDAELRTCSKKVTVMAGAPPVPATVTLRTMKTEGMMDANVHYDTNPVTLEGENLTLGEGDRLYMKLYDDTDDRYVEIPSRFVKRNTSAAIDLGADAGDDNIWNWIDQNCQPTEEHDRLTVKLVSHGGVPSSDPQTLTATSVVQFA